MKTTYVSPYESLVRCPFCNGLGARPMTPHPVCPMCDGKGLVTPSLARELVRVEIRRR